MSRPGLGRQFAEVQQRPQWKKKRTVGGRAGTAGPDPLQTSLG